MKILAGFVEDGRHSGIDKVLLQFLDAAKENGVKVDFLTSRPDEGFRLEMEKKGVTVYPVPSLHRPFAQKKEVARIVREGGYDLYYHNISEPLNFPAAKGAKRAGAKVILHSHSSGMDIENPLKRGLRGVINRLSRPVLARCGDRFFACSDKAAKWLFPEKRAEKAVIIHNAVDFRRFAFSPEKREETRRGWGVAPDEKVLLFVGHLCWQKNVFFLLPVLEECLKKFPARLVLAGTGGEEARFRAALAEKGLETKVTLLGVRRDTEALYSAADVFLFPSLFEGFGIAAAEAQASGLPLIASENVPEIAVFSDRALRLPLDAKKWAQKAEAFCKDPRRAGEIPDEAKQKFDLSFQKQQWSEHVFLWQM